MAETSSASSPVELIGVMVRNLDGPGRTVVCGMISSRNHQTYSIGTLVRFDVTHIVSVREQSDGIFMIRTQNTLWKIITFQKAVCNQAINFFRLKEAVFDAQKTIP